MAGFRTGLGLCAVLLAHGVAHADVQQGRMIAQQRCAACHAIEATGDSPHRITPPFRDLHQRFPVDMLVEAARNGVVEGHDEMPMFQFTSEQARALLSYIDSLSPTAARYLKP